LTVTTDQNRMATMMETLRQLHVPRSPGASLFFFATRGDLIASEPLAYGWQDGRGRAVSIS
jgi:hypothetical protein